MNYNSLSRLYPNLNISKVIQQNQIPTLQLSQPQQPKAQQPPTPPPTPKPAASAPAPVPKPAAPAPAPKPAAPTPTPPPAPAPKPAAPAPAPVPKPEPKKGPTMPAKGQRGIQKSLTEEEQKKQYLDKLSKMSVKRADTQLSKIEKVLEENKHDKVIMKSKELALKKQLKLINEAMLFGKEEEPTPKASVASLQKTEPINEPEEEEAEVEEEENI